MNNREKSLTAPQNRESTLLIDNIIQDGDVAYIGHLSCFVEIIEVQ